ncbi:hypothetical protein Stsp01_20630 [Streptomyces sp. NBRC 13847]|nr:hypothetical protein Stsp01_20630 [Streptomyces sp. NBRC 13847]
MLTRGQAGGPAEGRWEMRGGCARGPVDTRFVRNGAVGIDGRTFSVPRRARMSRTPAAPRARREQEAGSVTADRRAWTGPETGGRGPDGRRDDPAAATQKTRRSP